MRKPPLILACFLRSRGAAVFVVAGPVVFVVAYGLGLVFWGCPFHAMTGLDCPGCGMTRALESLALGHIRMAAEFHPFVFPFVALWLLFVVAACMSKRRREAFADLVARIEERTWIVPIGVALFFLFGFGRIAWEVWRRFSG